MPALRPAGRVGRAPLHGRAHVRALPARDRSGRRGRGHRRRPVRHRDEPPARARASVPRACARRRCCCAPGTRRSRSTCSRALSLVDWGDLAVTPGNAERTAGQIHDGLRPLVAAGVTPLVLGGDHSIVLGELRAHAERHGPLALVLLDAHADTWDAYYGERYFHGTPFRRALEEGLIAPERSTLAGMRGPLYAAVGPRRAARLGLRDPHVRRSCAR